MALPAWHRRAAPSIRQCGASRFRMARAPVVAFLEEHAFVAPGWARSLLAAHRQEWAAVGAEVHNANPRRWLSRYVALMNYHPWLPPAPRAAWPMLPGNNVSFKRDLLLAYGDRLPELLRAEIVLHSRLVKDGHGLLLEPDAKFFHLNDARLGSCARGFFLFHRLYAPARAAEFEWSAARRWLYALATPLVPLYFLLRLFAVLARRRPRLLLTAAAASPCISILQLAAAAGQATGLLFGPGSAEAEFTDYELTADRGPVECEA
jgi:hypothetical protein